MERFRERLWIMIKGLLSCWVGHTWDAQISVIGFVQIDVFALWDAKVLIDEAELYDSLKENIVVDLGPTERRESAGK